MSNHQGDPRETFRARMPRKYRLGLLLLGAVSTTLAVVGMLLDGLTAVGLLLGVLLAVTFIAIVMMQAVVRLDDEELTIKVAGIFGTSIPYRQIDGVAPDKVTGLGAGMGLRKLPNSTTGYLVGGPSVRISKGNADVLVSTDDPTELAAALERRRARSIR
ncbi:hypothetical protein E8P82_08365 [Arthrobacter echini]|uniref:PH domain-containing protein n=1 Tax=Arthrobacter echini TaxID=1529066 RepID=A0A4S5E4R4_9MICC|nr:hypothetical protein [Arthrobacter echini]THJ66467.1 hypothetical protein E8P82_08365 [Arthrobacter echini]